MFKRLVILIVGLAISAACSAADPVKPADAVKTDVVKADAVKTDRQWQIGQDYLLIDPPVATSTGNKIEVAEVFSYACPHCAHFQPYIDELKSKLPSNAQFVLVPAVFNPQWEAFARGFYTAQSLGLVDKTHQALFDALHRDHQPINSMDALADFYAQHGADKGTFLSTSTSFVIEGKIAHGNGLVHSYGVDATPTLIVNGKYRVVMSNEHNVGPKEVVDIALYLVKQEATAKKVVK
jgi:protein dithiol oxidoreductase (disulfide-forming)